MSRNAGICNKKVPFRVLRRRPLSYLFSGGFPNGYRFATAVTVSAQTLFAPARFRTEASSETVAPVVSVSSITRIRFPFDAARSVTTKQAARFFSRSALPSVFCAEVSRFF